MDYLTTRSYRIQLEKTHIDKSREKDLFYLNSPTNQYNKSISDYGYRRKILVDISCARSNIPVLKKCLEVLDWEKVCKYNQKMILKTYNVLFWLRLKIT